MDDALEDISDQEVVLRKQPCTKSNRAERRRGTGYLRSVVMHMGLTLLTTKLPLERKIHFMLKSLQVLTSAIPDTSSHVNQTSRANRIYLKKMVKHRIKCCKALCMLYKKYHGV